MHRFGHRRMTSHYCRLPALPPELWEHIFLYLPGNALCHVRLVCRRFRNIVNGCRALSGRLALKLKRLEGEEFVIDGDFRPPPLVPVSSFTFQNWGLTAGLKWWWVDFGRKLTHVEMVRINLRFELLVGMLKEAPNLCDLRLSSVLFLGKGGKCAELDFRLDRMGKLKMERMYFSESTVEDVLDVFLVIFPRLKNFQLQYPTRLEVLQQILCSLQDTLERFEYIMERDEDSSMTEIFPVRVQETLLPTLCQLTGLRLKRISIDLCQPFEEEDWIQLYQAQPGIEELIVNVDRATILCNIADITPTIKGLTLHLTSPLEMYFLTRFEQLEFLKIHGNIFYFTYPIILGHLDEVCNPQLKKLQLVNLNLIGFLEYLLECPLIAHISLIHCHLEDRILSRTTFTNLRYLNLSQCSVHRDVLLFIFKSTPALNHVRLFQTLGIDDEIVLTLCKRAPNLRKLELDECGGVSDTGGMYIIRHAFALEELRLIETSLTRAMIDRLQKVRGLRVWFTFPRKKVYSDDEELDETGGEHA